jgi:hypothetical protein
LASAFRNRYRPAASLGPHLRQQRGNTHRRKMTQAPAGQPTRRTHTTRTNGAYTHIHAHGSAIGAHGRTFRVEVHGQLPEDVEGRGRRERGCRRLGLRLCNGGHAYMEHQCVQQRHVVLGPCKTRAPPTRPVSARGAHAPTVHQAIIPQAETCIHFARSTRAHTTDVDVPAAAASRGVSNRRVRRSARKAAGSRVRR